MISRVLGQAIISATCVSNVTAQQPGSSLIICDSIISFTVCLSFNAPLRPRLVMVLILKSWRGISVSVIKPHYSWSLRV